MADATSHPPLDSRKYPWHRGDVVTLGFKKSGFVLDSTPEYLEILWMPETQVERLGPAQADDLLRIMHGASMSPGGSKTNAEVLDVVLALDSVGTALEDRMRTVRTEPERELIDSLISRVFATEGCDWDRAHQGKLWALAVKPSEVGLLFKIEERIHRMFCKKH